MHRLLASLSTIAVLLGVLVVATPAASATVPHAPRAFGRAIEDYTAYVPQDSCDSRPKKGTIRLATLLTRTYKGTTYGTYRPCDGSVSEHHDGRAIDWMVSSRNR